MTAPAASGSPQGYSAPDRAPLGRWSSFSRCSGVRTWDTSWRVFTRLNGLPDELLQFGRLGLDSGLVRPPRDQLAERSSRLAQGIRELPLGLPLLFVRVMDGSHLIVAGRAS